MTTTENGTPVIARTTVGRPKKGEYILQVNISRRVRGNYVKGTSRSLALLNAPWQEDEFMALVERMAKKAAGKSVPTKATTRVVQL